VLVVAAATTGDAGSADATTGASPAASASSVAVGFAEGVKPLGVEFTVELVAI
jgi:hypothetical protein